MAKFPLKTLKPKRLAGEQKFCGHHSLEVDQSMRMLKCIDCGITIDPFEFLWGWANRQWVLEYRVDDLQEQAKNLCDRIVELKREEQCIKARLKRAKS